MPAKLDENTQFVGIDGLPLVNGKIYIGTVALDPVANLITIYSDRDLSVPIANPQALDSQGRPTNKIWIPGRYSFQVNDVDAVQQIQDLDAGEVIETGLTSITNIQGTNAITGEGSPAITSYTDRETYVFKAANDNTDAITLNWDAVGAKALVFDNNKPLFRNHIKQNQIVAAVYNATLDKFEWRNPNRTIRYGNQGDDIASAGTVDLSLATGNALTVTGAVGPITSFGTVTAGSIFHLTFASTPTITHSGTALKIIGESDRTVVAGERWGLRSLGAGNWEVIYISPTDGIILTPDSMATQTEQEAGSSTIAPVTPGRQQFHPSAAKGWVLFDASGSPSITTSYNVTSIGDGGTGLMTINWATDFSSANYSWAGSAQDTNAQGRAYVSQVTGGSRVAGSVAVSIRSESLASLIDSVAVSIIAFGDQ